MRAQGTIGRLSTTQLAWLARCAKETASKKLREAQLEPVAEDGKTTYYDPREALPVLLGIAEGVNPIQERARLDRARAQLTEHEVARRREGLVPREGLAHVVVALEAVIAPRIARIASDAAREIAPTAAAQPKVRGILARYLAEACEDLTAAARRARRELKHQEQHARGGS